MSGYIRQDTTGAISTGNIIEADDLNAEYNAIEGAFNAATGHTHDGTSAEGAPITVIGPAQDVVATTSVLRPKTNNTVDLGTAALKYKDIHSAGTAFLAAITATGNVTIGGTLGVTGMLTASGGVTGALTGNASTATALQTARTLTIGSTGKTFNGTADVSWSLSEIGVGTLGQQNSNSVTITGGTINGTSIGATTASTGAFTTLTTTGDVTIPDRIIHAGDTDTQIRFPANDTVTVETNGAERLRVTSAGNVGIGTNSPTQKLTVGGGRIGLDNSQAFAAKDTGGTYRNLIAINASNATVIGNTATNNRVFIEAGGSGEALRINSAGNVGIGTSSPERPLQVNGIFRIAGNSFSEISNNSGAGREILQLRGKLNLSDGAGINLYGDEDSSLSGHILFFAGGSERLRIDSAGKILAAAGTNWVGTVSQNGQSSIIERGSNANGEFVKYADGTMLAYRRVDLTAGEFPTSLGSEVGINTEYRTPASFAEMPSVHLTAIAYSGAGGNARKAMSAWIRDQAISVTASGSRFTRYGVLLRLEERQFDAPSECSLFFSAIGRWY